MYQAISESKQTKHASNACVGHTISIQNPVGLSFRYAPFIKAIFKGKYKSKLRLPWCLVVEEAL
jgi:hypothetical protein